MSFADHQRVRARMDQLLGVEGAFVDDYLFCPHHPQSGFEGEVEQLKVFCECRKPEVGLAVQAQSRHALDLARSVMVGDTHRDRGFAERAGMRFIHVAETTYDQDDHTDCYSESAAAIRRGIEIVTC